MKLKVFKILAFPKSKDVLNPNILNLNAHLDKIKNIEVKEFGLLMPFICRYDLFHLHWPDYFFVKSLLKTVIRVIYFLFIIIIFKLLNTKLIWTVHNLEPHNNYHPRFNRFVVFIWSICVDGFIIMSNESYRLITKRFPILKHKKYKLIHHGLYENYKNQTTKLRARDHLRLNNDNKILLYFGTISKYKNIPFLLKEFNKINSLNITLIIAGNVKCKKLKREIVSLSNKSNIILNLSYIEEDDIQFYFNACDLVVIPSENILNSGSAMLALTFRKPIYCPNTGTMKDLENVFGSNTIITYRRLNLKSLENIFKIIKEPNEIKLKNFDNEILANNIFKFYNYIISYKY